MDRRTRFGSPDDWRNACTSSEDGKTVFDKMQEVAEAALAEQEEEKPIPPPSMKRLDSYAIAALAQRMAMVSRMAELAHHRVQSRKLVRRYNRR